MMSHLDTIVYRVSTNASNIINAGMYVKHNGILLYSETSRYGQIIINVIFYNFARKIPAESLAAFALGRFPAVKGLLPQCYLVLLKKLSCHAAK